MPLPFEQGKGRVFDCFCCGLRFVDYPEFKSHVITSHEEGRDYILCPFSHCQAPVRDVRAHCNHIHKNLKMPEKGMMRATIWRDIKHKDGEKKVKTRKPKFREGFYRSTKMKQEFHYRSGYEVKVYECLDADVEVTAYDVEGFISIPYIHKGKAHVYKPDILVNFLGGKTTVLEIKPSSQTMLEINKNKWFAANEACKARGWEFMVLTEIGIDKWVKKVRDQKNL